ncbi:MAG: hypothetical protein NNA21_02685 [Nitrospira sp.]|nr:hypothetical protein [Nitrospira sp.]MCP9461096.1 hypothetical protein [Nitrospira sp.]MCP9473761.1 hypothetical protein [Nitrospira sp.]
MDKNKAAQFESPEERRLTERQALYLSRLANLEVKQLIGLPLAKAHELLKWRLDPALLLFRRICGRVVKLNPATGNYEAVPNATVHVEDTDCSFLGFFPVGNPFFWLFPIRCRREVLTTVTTDACGNFCVYLPYWDIDRYIRFRRERICFPEIFKPNLRDLLRPLIPDLQLPVPPFPPPDPPLFRLTPQHIDMIRTYADDTVIRRLEAVMGSTEFGANVRELDAELDRPVFSQPVPPPIPSEIRRNDDKGKQAKAKMEINVAELAGAPSAAALLEQLDVNRFIGPFWRCRDVFVPVWQAILDVPDLTFRVTQDVDGDGNEETIYSESFFDVRWNAPSNLHVTLIASGAAISTPHCGTVQGIVCQDIPAIVTAGYMPLEPTHHDDSLGVATRVNRPRPPDGRSTTPQSYPAHAPYARTLNLHGCHRIGNATHYRLTYSYQAPETSVLTASVPFTGLEWWMPRLGPGAPIHVVPDVNGWYPILSAGLVAHPNWLLSWPTHNFPRGLYEIRLELGVDSGSSITVTHTSSPRRFLVDNSSPVVLFHEIRWRSASIPLAIPWTDSNSTLLPAVCPVLIRPAGMDVHLRVVWQASAAHLRDAQLSASGCGAGALSFETDEDTYYRWHINQNDNSVPRTAVLRLPGDRPPGCYHVRIEAWGRQFNPSGFDHGPSANWLINQVIDWNSSTRSISVVNS